MIQTTRMQLHLALFSYFLNHGLCYGQSLCCASPLVVGQISLSVRVVSGVIGWNNYRQKVHSTECVVCQLDHSISCLISSGKIWNPVHHVVGVMSKSSLSWCWLARFAGWQEGACMTFAIACISRASFYCIVHQTMGAILFCDWLMIAFPQTAMECK